MTTIKKGIFRYFLLLEFALIFGMLTILQDTDSYYSAYLLIGLLGVVSATFNFKKKESFRFRSLTSLFSAFFSLCISLANYRIFEEISASGGMFYTLLAIIAATIVFSGSFIIFQNLLILFEKNTIKICPRKNTKNEHLKFFLLCFAIFAIVDLVIFFSCFYPGILTSDSIDEINQIFTNIYSDHHPFYFTLLVKMFVTVGIRFFHDVNCGVALFSVFQILVLSTAFAYALLTLYEKGVPKKVLVALAILTALLPYNIMYSFTMWKDVLFGAGFLFITVSLYRYFNFASHRRLMSVIIVVNIILLCLLRSNALLAFVVAAIIFFVIFRKAYLKLGAMIVIAVVIAFLLKIPVLRALNVPGADNIESLSIPMQQITRTIVEHEDTMQSDDLELINHVVNPDTLASVYDPTIHDPIKLVIRLEGDKQYLSEHMIEFAALYARLCVQYPDTYLKAWIDQTRGYWNGGYEYWVWGENIDSNEYGIVRVVNSTTLQKVFNVYLDIFQTEPLNIMVSIGLAVWTLLVIFYLALIRKDLPMIYILTLFVLVWGTLIIATPVFAEFRYIYFLFTSLPFTIIVSISKGEKCKKIK